MASMDTSHCQPLYYPDTIRVPRSGDDIYPPKGIARNVCPYSPSVINTTRSLTVSAMIESAALASPDLWLMKTLQLIVAQRNALSGEMLDTAELVAEHLAGFDVSLRPQLAFDDDGIPHFAIVKEEFYLSLSVDFPYKITFFAVLKNEEFFAEGISFDGDCLPKEVSELFKKASI